MRYYKFYFRESLYSAPQLLHLLSNTVMRPQLAHFLPRPPFPELGGTIISYPHWLHLRLAPVVLKKVNSLQLGQSLPAILGHHPST
jgi:hypothetical protein